MIDFRFHLISLVAVFLALGLGILMGSVVLDQQLVNILEKDISQLRTDKRDLQDDVISLETQLEADTRFADIAEEWLLADALSDRDVIIARFAGTDDRITDGVRTAIEAAGGRVPATVTFTERFALPGAVERDQLALAVESSAGEAAELRTDAGDFIGTRLASAVTAGSREGRVDAADNALVNLLLELEEAGFAELEGINEGQRVPSADVVLIGGGPDPRPFNLIGFATSFTTAAAQRGATVLVGGSSEDAWGFVTAVRDADVAEDVSTVDHAETVAGRIAAVLALRDAQAGFTDHYGTGAGAGDVIPRPTPQD